MFSLFSLILATKPEKWELKSFYGHLNDLPNVSYAIHQVKTHVSLHYEGYKATNMQYQAYSTINQRHKQPKFEALHQNHVLWVATTQTRDFNMSV